MLIVLPFLAVKGCLIYCILPRKVGGKFSRVSIKFHKLFLIKIHAKCSQLTPKTITLPILKITLMKHHLDSAWESQVIRK